MDSARAMKSTMRQRGDYGLKIAKNGYDVMYASDNQLLYNSSFPVLQIIMTINNDTEWEIVQTGNTQQWNNYNGTVSDVWVHKMRKLHGLGYPPMVVELATSSAFASNNKPMTWNTKYLYYEAQFNDQASYDAFIAGGADTGKFIVFGVDISTDVEYPYLDIGTEVQWGQTYDYGVKHLLTDDPNTTDPMKLGLNAKVQSLLVTAVKVATSSAPTLNQYMPSGISPSQLSPFCFVQNATTGRWYKGSMSVQAQSGYRPALPDAGINYYVLDGQNFGSKCSLVLVRSPMISADKYNYSFSM